MTSSLFLLLLLVSATSARYLSGRAIETQAGNMPMNGVSPVPTEAPGFNGIPKELRKRVIQNFIDPPPASWCGMIDGDYREFRASIKFFHLVYQLFHRDLILTYFKEDIVRCPPNIPCRLKSNFFITCDFNYDMPTKCLDYETYQLDPWIGDLTAAW